MKITKKQLRRIIREAWFNADRKAGKQRFKDESQNKISFQWDAGGLEMGMHVDGKKVLGFMRQHEVEELIKQLEDLLAGPMRTSP